VSTDGNGWAQIVAFPDTVLQCPHVLRFGFPLLSHDSQLVLKALAEPRRVAILKLVRSRELPAGDIARRFRTTRPTISQHLRVLVRAGLLVERRDRTRRLYRLRPEGFAGLRELLSPLWDASLKRLKSAVETDYARRR
jgi:DNA-binding transcriptional ArsR family regulator